MENHETDSRPWQCVMLCYGDRFSSSDVNRIVRAVKTHSPNVKRFVLLTDRDRKDLDTDIVARRLPEFFAQEEFMQGGCHAKLAMYETGVIPDDMVAIYVDLDTAILGDLSQALDILPSDDNLMMLHHIIIPFGIWGRLAYRLSNGRKYARGNSSMVVFHPANVNFVAVKFRELYGLHGLKGLRELTSDEHFLSWVAQQKLVTIPSRIFAKFHYEFMSVIPGWPRIKSRLPWIKAKRARLAAVTFCDPDSKIGILMQLKDGENVIDRRNRRLNWSTSSIGETKDRLIDYFG